MLQKYNIIIYQVSKEIKRVCDDKQIWKKYLRRDFNLNEDDINSNEYKKTGSIKTTSNLKIVYAGKWIRNRHENTVLKRCLMTWLRVELNQLYKYIDFPDKVTSSQHLKTK